MGTSTQEPMRSCVLLLSLLVGTAYGVPQFPGDGRNSESIPPTPVVDPPPIEDGPPMCCMAFTASCMACAQGVSMEEYCSSHPDTVGCPKRAPDIEPKLCCKALSASCMACIEGVSQRHFCRHNPATPGCEEVRSHTKSALFLRQLIQWAFGILIFMAGLIWGFFERRRRRRLTDHSQRVGGYIAGLFDCLRKPAMWIPACLFTPVLAAFNRSEVDERECSVCDVCFAVIKPIAQYTTRQSLRGKYGLASEEFSDLFSACCCTPCAVAQDAIELENRSSQDNNNALPAGLAAPGIPVFVMPTAQPVYAQVREKETFVESEMKSHRVTHAENQV